MKVLILCVGRLKDEAEQAIVDRYMQRIGQIGPSLGFSETSLLDLAESKAKTAKERKAAEAVKLRRKISQGTTLIALDERGKPLSSMEFAQRLGTMRDSGVRQLCFMIGGPDGLDPALAREAVLTLSFGRMTLPHGLVRAVLAEQIYRAATILAGHPYHRE